MKNRLNSGFTLIELLVVIAIIGILASVVLASLNNARQRGADAKIQAQLSNMRAQALLYTGAQAAAIGSGAGASPCAITGTDLFGPTNGGLAGLFNGLTLANTACSATVFTAGAVDQATWAVAATMSGTTRYFCVDSTGAARIITSGTLTAAIASNICI